MALGRHVPFESQSISIVPDSRGEISGRAFAQEYTCFKQLDLFHHRLVRGSNRDYSRYRIVFGSLEMS